MKTYIYEGGLGIVAKSGVGSAIKHQKNMLKQADIEEAKSWKEADIVHINTVFPDSVLAACLAKMQGKKVVYYGHSTMEDFRNSFIGSNRFAPLFKKWICFCYGLGDIVITPTEYSKGLLKSYGIQKKIYAVSNGVDTEFFQSRNKEKEKREISAGAERAASSAHRLGSGGCPLFHDISFDGRTGTAGLAFGRLIGFFRQQ